MNLEELYLETAAERVKLTLACPERTRITAQSGLLLNISATAALALHDQVQGTPTGPFLDAGHFVASFDLPCHGERVGEHGEGLLGMGAAYLAGIDMFARFVADGAAAIDACQQRGIGANGRVVGYGVSRAAYCLLRLAAADSRLRAVAGPSPCIDWGILEEFCQSCPRTNTWPLRLDNWVDELAHTAVYLSVGSQDDVVGTETVHRFAMGLFSRQRLAHPSDTPCSELHVVASPGHSPSRASRLDATRFLLERIEM